MKRGSDSDSSDYDPDETEVPGGGKNLSDVSAVDRVAAKTATAGLTKATASARSARVMIKPSHTITAAQQLQQSAAAQLGARGFLAGSAGLAPPRRKVMVKMTPGASTVSAAAADGVTSSTTTTTAAAAGGLAVQSAPGTQSQMPMLNPLMLQAMAGQLARLGLPPMSVPQMQQLLMQQLLNQQTANSQLGDSILNQEEENAEDEDEDMGVAETYADYMPSKLKIGGKHPDPVVETASLASVAPSDVWYQLQLPPHVINDRLLSALQLEAITYACQQHEQLLTDGTRAGFLIGDGAGVGKGRTIAGLIYENYLRGRKKSIWISVSNDLRFDAERDLADIGADNVRVHALNKLKYAKINSPANGDVKKGVVYSTYSSLIGESSTVNGKFGTRLKQLVQWCGDDFDGLVVFDECHRAKNLCPTGSSRPTKTGVTVLELQRRLPRARVVYASATGASEPRNMAYMVRLGIWGEGTPFRQFTDFISAVEKRGVGAMEIVAMDMKLRGCYMARQLSFHGTQFRVDDIPLAADFVAMYDRAVQLWVTARALFQRAAQLCDADRPLAKAMWAQFWSAHQRFFKYLCIGAKVKHVVHTASNAIKMGKCVVIGLQSTGEARTLEQLERDDGELTDFVSTAKGVVQSLIEKHFPAPDRDRINRLLGLSGGGGGGGGPSDDRTEAADDSDGDTAGASSKHKPLRQAARRATKRCRRNNSDSDSDSSDGDSRGGASKRKRRGASGKHNGSAGRSTGHDSDFKLSGSSASDNNDDDDDDDDDDAFSDASGKSDCAIMSDCSDSSSDGESYGSRRNGVKKQRPSKKRRRKADRFAYMSRGNSAAAAGGVGGPSGAYVPPSRAAVEAACKMKEQLLDELEQLAPQLPANTLDELIDQLGGPENVAEMTGRKGRVVQNDDGQIQYESRCEQDVPLETLNVAEKQRFMNGEKDIAVISEAASSGISLQSDRRVANQRRRVHITLELPWSADRAVQQFGRTHRSNQVNAPEYLFLISGLAGERRFASIVAKRLESLGALTHGDRRASESRDLSQFNIDNKYGRAALEATLKAVMGYERPLVPPPQSYTGNFFTDVKRALVGVGLITVDNGVFSLDKDFNNMSKFLNRILGMPVQLQNMLFDYFTDTLSAIVRQAKQSGRFDLGILDLGSQEGQVRRVALRVYSRRHATGSSQLLTQLHTVSVERGTSWQQALQRSQPLSPATDEGFYLSHQVRNGKVTAMLATLAESSSKLRPASRDDRLYTVCRPNTGVQLRLETYGEIVKKYRRVTAADEARDPWQRQFAAAASTCSHAYWRGACRRRSAGLSCHVGLRRRSYHVLSGSVLHVWTRVEALLTTARLAPPGGGAGAAAQRLQVIRVRCSDELKIVGIVIPEHAVDSVISMLEEVSDSHYEDKTVAAAAAAASETESQSATVKTEH